MIGVNGRNYHDAIILATVGSKVYVVGDDGKMLSGGHHRVEWDGSDNFSASTGASNYSFTVNTDKSNPNLAQTRR